MVDDQPFRKTGEVVEWRILKLHEVAWAKFVEAKKAYKPLVKNLFTGVATKQPLKIG